MSMLFKGFLPSSNPDVSQLINSAANVVALSRKADAVWYSRI